MILQNSVLILKNLNSLRLINMAGANKTIADVAITFSLLFEIPAAETMIIFME